MKKHRSKIDHWILLLSGLCLLAAGFVPDRLSAQPAPKTLSGPTLLKKLAATLPKVAKYDYGMSREPLTLVSDLLRQAQADPNTAREAEKQLLGTLQTKLSKSSQDFLCQQLSLIGTDQSIPVLESMLIPPETSNMARYALERIPGLKVNAALRRHLTDTADAEKIGIINTLGNRRDKESLSALEKLAQGSNSLVAVAAISALGKIAEPQTMALLARMKDSTSGASQTAVLDAYLLCIDQLMKEGRKGEATGQYRRLTEKGTPTAIRIAAFRGLVAADPSQAVPLLLSNLEKEDAAVQVESIRLLASQPNAEPAQQLLQSYPVLPSRSQAVVLTMLAGNKDSAVRDLMTKALKDQNADVRLAAISGLIQAGDASCIIPLAEIAANRTAEEQTAARQSLARLRHPEVDQAITKAMDGAEPKVKVELLRAMGERGSENAVANVLKLAKEGDSQVRREALRVARDLAGPSEVPELLNMLVSSRTSSVRTETERALSSTLRRYQDVKIDPILSAYKQQTDPQLRTSLLTVLADTENPLALTTLKEALKDTDVDVKRAAILGLSGWSDPSVPVDLLAVAQQTDVPAHRILALRGLVNSMNRTATKRKPAESVKMLNQALVLATQPEEKKTILGALPRYSSKEALKTAQGLLKDQTVAEEAKLAVNAIKQQLAEKKKK